MNRRPPKRHTITATTTASAVTKPLNLNFPSLFHLCRKSERFLVSVLRRFLSKFFRFMDYSLFSYFPNQDDDDLFANPFGHSYQSPELSEPADALFLVSFRWWKEAVCDGGIAGGVGGTLYNAEVKLNGAGEDEEEGTIGGFGESEILVDMRRGGEVGISGEEEVSGSERNFALLSEWMFLSALKWHFDMKDVENLFPGGDSESDLFSIQIRILCALETNLLVIKISQKDNEVGAFNRAYSIFSIKYGSLQIWDFSGRTSSLFLGEKLVMDSDETDHQILLELQIYRLSFIIKDEERKEEEMMVEHSMINGQDEERKEEEMMVEHSMINGQDEEWREEEMMVEHSMINGPSSSASFSMNGHVDKVNLFPKLKPSFSIGSGCGVTCALGLTGLRNLGNTCFMNSAIQCLVHTPKLVDYFLGDFKRDLNFENPLGLNGNLAMAFGDLLRKIWIPGLTPVVPRMFKSTISSFAPQFSGYNQHDSQEFLAFLLDGLHEDLNRVKSKPYVQAKDEDGRPVEEVANEYWANHLSRNDSVIVDLCQGQYRSMLVCPVCKKLSITFDPFMYLSLPLPSTALRTMTLTVLNTDGTSLPHPVTTKVLNNGTLKDLAEALGKACSLGDDERLLIAEIYNNCILRILEDLNDSIELIRDNDQLVAYRLPKETDGSPLIEFIHQREEKSYLHSFSSHKKFGIPLVARMSDFSKGSNIHTEFLKLINPFLMPAKEFLNDTDALRNSSLDRKEMEDEVFDGLVDSDNEAENSLSGCSDFQFHLDSGTFYSRCFKIQMNEPVPIPKSSSRIKVLATWSEKMIEDYETSILSLLPEVCEPAFMSKRPQDSVSLYKCVDAFLKEEPLGPEDMWYCPNCKDRRQASKKLDLWRTPEILVIHLKRFSYNRIFKNKLETFVDFPVDDFDLSNYIIHKNSEVSCRYILYAVSNHYGGMAGGHYTAFAKHGRNRWYEFDDSHVSPVTVENIKTSAAYVLFYKRI